MAGKSPILHDPRTTALCDGIEPILIIIHFEGKNFTDNVPQKFFSKHFTGSTHGSKNAGTIARGSHLQYIETQIRTSPNLRAHCCTTI